MMSRSSVLLAAWIAIQGLAGGYVATQLQVSGDLRLFLPARTTEEQRFLIDGLGEGPAARLVLVALEGADPETLVAASKTLVEDLHSSPQFFRVENGSTDIRELPERLFAYQYLLSPTLDEQRLDAPFLRSALQDRLKDLSRRRPPSSSQS